jgi:hypothetical protein
MGAARGCVIRTDARGAAGGPSPSHQTGAVVEQITSGDEPVQLHQRSAVDLDHPR